MGSMDARAYVNGRLWMTDWGYFVYWVVSPLSYYVIKSIFLGFNSFQKLSRSQDVPRLLNFSNLSDFSGQRICNKNDLKKSPTRANATSPRMHRHTVNALIVCWFVCLFVRYGVRVFWACRAFQNTS